MARILNRHSQIFITGEMHYFYDIYARRREFQKNGGKISENEIVASLLSIYKRHNEIPDQRRIDRLLEKNPKFSKKLKSCAGDLEALCTVFMETQMEFEGKARWGNSLPRDIFNIDEILECYPYARIIVCVRDIRDFLLSYQYKWRVTTQDRVEAIKKTYHPVVTSLMWKSSMRLIPFIRNRVPHKNLLILKYEDLVREPEPMIRKICNFIGEEYEPVMLEVNFDNSSFRSKEKGIFSTSVGRWLKRLPREEAYIGQRIACQELRSLGYSLEKISFNPFKLALIFLSLPFAMFRALNVGKGKSGPISTFLFKRARALLKQKKQEKG
jgi:hypothetical protein